MEVPYKIKNRTIYEPTVSLLGIYPKKIKTLPQKDMCILMFIAAFFKPAKMEKQHKCPFTDEGIKNRVCV